MDKMERNGQSTINTLDWSNKNDTVTSKVVTVYPTAIHHFPAFATRK